ncbi:type IV secretory pathway AvhB4 domain protein (plasmid) [Sphingobium sp. RAC03]|nr:type IV secretory pathway AvhB4 domain protein [Sphingobium sp. RAC03]
MSKPMKRVSSVISSAGLSNTHPIEPRDVHFSRRAPMPPASDMPSIERRASSERSSRGSRITAAMPSSIIRSS